MAPVVLRVIREALTVDNLLHSLVAMAFTGVLTYLFPFLHVLWAALAALLLYLREAWQVDWSWALPDKHTGEPSLHKHMEWITGSLAGLATAVITAMVRGG